MLRQQQDRSQVIEELAEQRAAQHFLPEAFALHVKNAKLLLHVLRVTAATLRASSEGQQQQQHQQQEQQQQPGQPPMRPSETVRSEIARTQSLLLDVLQRADSLQPRLTEFDVTVSAEKILYDFAMFYGREAAVDELYKNYIKSEYFFRQGMLLLEQLLADATTQHDHQVLRDYIQRFSARLQEVQRKKAASDLYVNTSASGTAISLAAQP